MELTTAGFYGFPEIDAIDWYHLSKVFDSNNMRFAQLVYGLSITDFRIGIVHGTQTTETREDEKLATSFYFDFWFGTLLNRFCAQASVDYPLTVYGKGGQTRAYISLNDAAEMIFNAIENKVEGEYRVINAFVDCASVQEIAEKIQRAGKNIGIDIAIMRVPNPRIEIEECYVPEDTGLTSIGFEPKNTIANNLETVLRDLARFKERIIAKKDKFLPRILREKAKIEK
jgi:nucleoside-diphosphate-sugar epimerase